MHQRNFRSAYLKTLGIRGVQVKVSIENVLNDEVIDTARLSKLCTNFGVPAVYRVMVWKVLLGVSPRYRAEWAAVQEQRVDQYQYVKRAISTLCGRPAQLAEGEPLTAEVLVKMCLLTHKVDVHTMLSSQSNPGLQHMHAIAQAMLGICEDEADAYWLAYKFLLANNLLQPLSEPMACLQASSRKLHHSLGMLQKLAWAEDAGLCSHLHRLGVSFDSFALRWLRSLFAEDLPLSSIERIWDRVIGCHAPMCVYIALATLCTFRHVLVPMRTRDSVQGFLSKLPDGYIDRILETAVQLYEKYGGQDADFGSA